MAYQLEKSDQILAIRIWEPVLNPAEAEVHFAFTLKNTPRELDFRGRLMGPRCPYAATVEIAYYFRPTPGIGSSSPHTISGRVVIPEPSLWDPISPYLYQGPVEVWSEGKPVVQLQVSHGLHSLHLGPAGLRWNGKPLKLQAHICTHLTDDLTSSLREPAFNTVILPISEVTPALLQLTDRYGMLVLARLDSLPESRESLAGLAEHVSFLGWLVSETIWRQVGTEGLVQILPREKQLLGLELATTPAPDSDLSFASFISCEPGQQPFFEKMGIPRLVRDKGGDNGSGPALPTEDGLLGVIK